jgi:hypothetical protein
MESPPTRLRGRYCTVGGFQPQPPALWTARRSRGSRRTLGVLRAKFRFLISPRLVSRALPPIIDQKDTRSVVPSLVRAVHRHALKLCAEVTLKHQAVRFVSGSIHSGNQT